MKVLHVSSALSWRGGEQQIAWLLEELRALNIEQHVYCPAGTPLAKFLTKNNFSHSTYIKKSSLSFSAAKGLAACAKGCQATLVHMHDSHAHTYAVMATTFFGLKKPLVLSRRVDFPIGKNWSSRWKYNHKAIQKIICVSDFINQLIRPKIKSPEKVLTVHSGVDPSRFFHKASGKLHALINIDKSKTIVGNVAAIAPHKDFFTFVDACAVIHQQEPEIEFVIIGGDGGEKEMIREYISKKGLSEKIHLPGFQKNEPELLPDIAVLLFSSKTEGLGTSLLDAAAAGVPIVATRAGGIPEIVVAGENGILADVGQGKQLADGVIKLLQDMQLREQFITQGKKNVQRFTKKETARKTLAVYDAINS